jgi:cell division transport system permease protein
MKINTIGHFVKDAAKNLKRNRTMSTASVATVAATLFILGVFLLTITNIQQIMKDINSQVEIKIILEKDIKIDVQQELEKNIKATAGVESVTYESKEQALENLKTKFGEKYKSLLEGYEADNPLPSSYIIKVTKPEAVTGVVESIKGKPGIETIKDAKELVDKLIAISNAIKWFGIAVFAILIGVSLFLIGNTIKLTVYARRREIGIMKYIGATDWFIRWPFIIEGIVIGIIGGGTASLLLYYGYRFIYTKMATNFLMIQLINPAYVLNTILLEFVLGGIFIGVIGSITAIRKFLSV